MRRFREPWHAVAAVKFPSAVEEDWLVASTVGFCLDVFVYHTFSLFMKSVMRFMIAVTAGTDNSTLAVGASRSLDAASCAFASVYSYY